LEKVFSTAQIFGRRRCEVSAWETMQRPTPRSVPPNLSALHEQGVTATRAVVPSAAAAFEAQLISIIDVSISKELPHLGPCSVRRPVPPSMPPPAIPPGAPPSAPAVGSSSAAPPASTRYKPRACHLVRILRPIVGSQSAVMPGAKGPLKNNRVTGHRVARSCSSIRRGSRGGGG
jgi:hypothetical protein